MELFYYMIVFQGITIIKQFLGVKLTGMGTLGRPSRKRTDSNLDVYCLNADEGIGVILKEKIKIFLI